MYIVFQEFLKNSHVLIESFFCQNILIHLSGVKNSTVTFKISDFGLCKLTNEQGSFSDSGKGTPCYLAPELLKRITRSTPKGRGTNDCDIFALGCVFFFFLTRGLHPYGKGYIIHINILKKKFNLTSNFFKIKQYLLII